MKIYIAADHAGFSLKEELVHFLREEGYEVDDCGAYEYAVNDDYPEIVARAAKKLSSDVAANPIREAGKESRAIIIGASGQGEAIVANRFKGVRAVVYYGVSTVQMDASGKSMDVLESTRKHNDANALSLAARFMTPDSAKAAVKEWLETPFAGEERHLRRIQKINDVVS